jgi:predicted site-specific integrase-resolvase
MLKIDNFISAKAMAALLGVNAQTLRKWALAGKFPYIKHPINKTYMLFDPKDAEYVLKKINSLDEENSLPNK